MEETINQPTQSPTSPGPSSGPQFNGKKKRFALIGAIVLLAIAIPTTIFLSQQTQDTRQRASSATCQIDNVDVMLVMDTSNSMQGSNLSQAKAAANSFAAKVLPNATGPNDNRIGVASFDNNGGLNLALSENRNSVTSVINSFSTPGSGKGGTCLECALDKNGTSDVRGAFANSSRPKNKKHIIILTDAKINRFIKPDGKVDGSTNAGDEKKARDQALNAVNRIVAENPGTSVFVVQYGGNANASWVAAMRRNEGTTQSDSSGKSMGTMYEEIANQLMGGTVVAEVHDDLNKNGQKEANEGPLAGVSVKLEYVTDPKDTETKLTDGLGRAVFSGRCNRPQTLSVTPLQNYEMSPANSGTRTIQNVPENGEVKESFLLKKQVNATSLVCDPTAIAVSGQNQTITAVLKDKDGNPLANKTIIWSKDNDNITFVTAAAQASTRPVTVAQTVKTATSVEEVSSETFFSMVAENVVKKAYAACNGNRDCGGGQPYCVGNSCVECRNVGSANDCNNGKVCNQNHKCVAPPATPTTLPTATKTPTTPPTVTTGPTVTSSPSLTTTPPVTLTPAPGTVIATTDANGRATITFTKNNAQTGASKTAIKAGFTAEGIYTEASCSSEATYTPPAPELTLTANPPEVNSGGSSTLTWTTKNVTSCTASEGWTGTKNAQGGTESTGPLTAEKNYVLTCTGPGGEVTKDVTVNITAGPSITAAPGDTALNLEILLHGIGASGDNVVLRPEECVRASGNTNENCLSNQSPLHPTRPLTIEMYNTNNELVKTAVGTMQYDNALGGFKATIPLGADWVDGQYRIRAITPMFLKKVVINNHEVKKGQVYTVPEFDLVSSDVNNDNKLSLLDWNLIAKCYTFPGVPSACNNEEILVVDTNDDGVVNDFDTTLFKRDLTVQYGQ